MVHIFERNTEIVKPWLFPYEFYELKSDNLSNELTSEQIESFLQMVTIKKN